MRGLAITQENLTNQQGVVANEVKVNVLNRPYGGFPWLPMPQYANTNWYNAHNFYGDLKDLEAANLDDVQSFFKTYYAPSNAALVVVGDIDPVQTMAWVKQYFGTIPAGKAPAQPDISEPRQEQERRATKEDPQASRPALAVAWHMPARNTPQYWAMGLIDQMLVQGRDSRLYQALVQKRGLTGEVGGGINDLGNMFNVKGPTLFGIYLFHDQDKSADEILKAVDEEVEKLRAQPVDQATLDLAMVKMRSSLYDAVEDTFGFGKADLLASFALFDNDPARINHLEEEFAKVTPQVLHETAKEYLRPTNRTILTLQAKAAAAPAASGE
jgi:predicted Zn-dependent peptidase